MIKAYKVRAYKDNHSIIVEFNDRSIKKVDMSRCMFCEVGEPLNEPNEFAKLYINHGLKCVAWPCGMYACPDWLYQEGIPYIEGEE